MSLIQKYPHITELFACILNMFVFNVFMSNKMHNLFRNMFYSKTIKVNNFNIFYIQSNPVYANICIFIKIYDIFTSFYFFKQITSRINTIKYRLISIVIFLFQILSEDVVELKILFISITCSQYTITCSI